MEAVAEQLAFSESSRIKQLSTPLTGSHRSARYSRSQRRAKAVSAAKPRPTPACKRCGGPVPRPRRVYCDNCLPSHQHKGSGITASGWAERRGHDPTHGDDARAARATSNILRKQQAREWEEQHGKLVDLSAFQRDILPLIQDIPLSRLQKATGLSLRYVSLIRQDERTPHPRHWLALVGAAGTG